MITVDGGPALISKLAALPPKIEKKLIRPALRAGGKTILEQAKADAPTASGMMKQRLALRVRKTQKNQIGFKITFRDWEQLVTYSKAGRRYFYPAGIEYGHGGREGYHFIRKATDETWPQAQRTILDTLQTGIEQLAAQ